MARVRRRPVAARTGSPGRRRGRRGGVRGRSTARSDGSASCQRAGVGVHDPHDDSMRLAMAIPARLVWLFDIDGTLLNTDGAAREAIAFAVHECLGVEDDLRDIAFAGRTDPLILADILRKHRRALQDGEGEHFWATAHGRMDALLTP